MTGEQKAVIVRMWAEGESLKSIARETGLSLTSVNNYACTHRDECPYRYRIVTFEEVSQIRELRAKGLTSGQIAIALGIDKMTVRRHWKGQR